MDEDGLKTVELYPIELGFNMTSYRKGWPKLSRDEKVIDRLIELSAEFKTEIIKSEGKGIIKIK